MIPEKIWSAYRRKMAIHPARKWEHRNHVYTWARMHLPDQQEARHTRDIKNRLDQIDNELAGRDTTSDWRMG